MNSLQWLGCTTRVLQLSMQVALSLLGLIGFEAHEDWPQGFRLSGFQGDTDTWVVV